MKKIVFIVIVFLNDLTSYGQSVAINTDASAPNASAILDIKSVNKGLLIPRMSTVQRTAIAAPAAGLQVFDITTNSIWFYNGSTWNALSAGSATNYWTPNGSNIFNNNAGNVGIGLSTPLAPLHIKKDLEALRIEGNSAYLSFYNAAGTVSKSFLQNSGDNLYLGTSTGNATGITQLYSNASPLMTLLPSGNVGIGTVAPVEKLTVQTLNNTDGISHRGENGNILATRMGGTSAGIGTFSNTNMRIFSGSLSRIFINASDGYVGLGGDFPVNKFQIGSIINAGANYVGNDFAIGNAGNAMRILQSNNATVIASDNTNMVLWPKEATGNVGINTLNLPANKLQIGSVGGTGFAGNDLALGNGTNAMAIYQTNEATLIGSTTDIVLKPRNNGQGRVGINTNTPRAPLEVTDGVDVGNPNGLFYTYLNLNSNNVIGSSAVNPIPNISIFCSGRILAKEVNVYSDTRIKNIVGISNTTKDLQTINAIQITDYTMKDKIKYRNKPYKKVIAQQVEEFYPQVVSKHTDFIPNVYQPTNKVTKTTDGYLLSFSNQHNISSTAKKLQIILSDGMEQFEIVSIPSGKEVIIKATEIKTDKVFVYGEEVDDFRTVDYEGLTTLNISATQELSKLIQAQQAALDEQNKKIAILVEEIKLLKERKTITTEITKGSVQNLQWK